MKITPNTTLGELAVELGKRGVVNFHASIAPNHVRTYYVTLLSRNVVGANHDYKFVGEGMTLAAAIDDALARLIHRSVETLP